MTPEADAHLRKALSELDDAGRMVAIGLARASARAAYYAAFHAAEAYIVEQTGKIAKTHPEACVTIGEAEDMIASARSIVAEVAALLADDPARPASSV